MEDILCQKSAVLPDPIYFLMMQFQQELYNIKEISLKKS